MPRVLVTGSADRVEEIAVELERAGAEAVRVSDLGALADEVAGLGEGALDGYVQLPVSVTSEGATVVDRVRHFLQAGLLARFEAANTVLPSLKDAATVILVSGNLPPEMSEPDEPAARQALLRVLGHAVRADAAPAHVRVKVVEGTRPAGTIAGAALAEASDSGRRPPHERVERTYEDWRVEMMGLVSVDV